MEVSDLSKPRGQWCQHCDIGVGCTIYADRPRLCAGFYCGYLTLPDLSEEWWPAKAKIVLAREEAPDRLAVHVDPGRPNAWRSEPFFSTLKQYASLLARIDAQLIVYIGSRVVVILPDREVDLGVVEDDDLIMTAKIPTADGFMLDAFKMKKPKGDILS
jgi:hypothetical protein